MNPPPRLYKYRGISKYTSDIFCRRVLWFCRPESLNDPYDCRPVYDTTIDKDGYRDHVRSTWSLLYPHWTEDKLDAEVRIAVEHTWPPDDREVEKFKREYQARIASIGVFSTSARYDSVVMWSHYADSHRGICIEFDSSAFSSNVSWWPVIYQQKRPVINLFRDHLQANCLASRVKNEEWSYEEEWRLTLESTDATPSFPLEITLPDDAIVSVILGARIAESDRQRVTDWCNLLPKRPVIYQAFDDDAAFKMNRRTV